GVMNQVAEFLAVAGAAARVRVEHDVAHGSPGLLLDIEAVAVVRERTTVNLENQRIFLCRIEIRRLDNPAFNLALVLRGVPPDLLDRAGLFLREQLMVKRRQHTRRASSACHCYVAGARAGSVGERDCSILRHRERAAESIRTRAGSDMLRNLPLRSFIWVKP